MSKEFLRPEQGRKVRTPDGGVLPPEGAKVEMSSYWRRRLRDGGVVKGKAETKAVKPAQDKPKGEGR